MLLLRDGGCEGSPVLRFERTMTADEARRYPEEPWRRRFDVHIEVCSSAECHEERLAQHVLRRMPTDPIRRERVDCPRMSVEELGERCRMLERSLDDLAVCGHAMYWPCATERFTLSSTTSTMLLGRVASGPDGTSMVMRPVSRTSLTRSAETRGSLPAQHIQGVTEVLGIRGFELHPVPRRRMREGELMRMQPLAGEPQPR